MATYWVATDGNDGNPGTEALPFLTIQFAIDQCIDPPNDEIIVKDGTYTGLGNVNLDFGGVDINLHSQNGADVCIIDAESAPGTSHFIFQTDETPFSIIDGFTLINANGTNGGAIDITTINVITNPTIKNCIIRDNTGARAGGINIDTICAAIIDNCVFDNNTSAGGATGLFVGELSLAPTIVTNCSFTNHTSADLSQYTIFIGTTALITLTNCLIADNSSGACFIEGAEPVFINCTITRNGHGLGSGSGQPGGLYLAIGTIFDPGPVSVPAVVTMENCIFWDNYGDVPPLDGPGNQCYIEDLTGNSYLNLYYSCYDNSVGHCSGDCANLTFDANCIFVDPEFVDPDGDDYRLSAGSPCIDDGFNDYNLTEEDLDGEPRIYNEIIDMGAYEWRPGQGWFYSVRAARPELKHTIITEGQVNRAYNC